MYVSHVSIQEDTVRLIYSYSEVDPADDDSITYHGTTRGTKSVSLLSQSKIPDSLPADVQHFEFLNNNVSTGREVLKTFFMLNSTEREISTAYKN